MFRANTEENVLSLNVDQWVDFIRSFTVPKEGVGQPWRVSDQPIVYLNLSVNLNARKKKTEKMDTIFFEPSYEVVKFTLLKPIEMIIQTLQSMPGLERDLVPLVDIKPSVAVVVSMEDTIF